MVMDDNKIIHGVWFGPQLTNIQRLSIRSYQDNGHEFHLWVSEPTTRVPDGTVVHDLNGIFPLERRARFTGTNYLSDYFRVLLIRELGGWYADVDTICLKHFDFKEPYAFVSEPDNLGPLRDVSLPPVPPLETPQRYLSGCIFKAPKGNELCQHIVDRLNGMDTLHPTDWICFGPFQFNDVIRMLHLERYVKPPVTFDAINYNESNHVVAGGIDWKFSDKAYAIHLRTSGWSAAGRDPNGRYPEDSLFEQLKRKHCV